MNTKQKHGFAAMSREKQRKIARLDGIAAHLSEKAHEFTNEEARLAGRKEGRVAGTTKEKSA